jgi:curli biogenesis system outer membrane secretion channel CsgG
LVIVMFRTFAVLALLIMTSHGAFAAAGKVEERSVTGKGEDQRSAILNGLIQAIEQVNGVQIEKKSVTYKQYADVIDDLRESFKSSVVNNAEIKTASKGLIDSYDVVSEDEDPQTRRSSVQLTVRVLTFDPNAALLAGRRKIIAVVPFRTAKQNYPILDANVPAKNMLGTLSQGLVTVLVQSRKFTVLDREFLSEMMGEQKLIQAGNMPAEELLRIGQQLGADFLLVGSLDDADANATTKTIQLTGRQVTSRSAKTAVAYRVLNVATGKIHWADTFRHTYGEDEFRNLSGSRAGLRTEELLMEDAAAVIADKVITGVFPIRVLKVTGREIILNQGGNRTNVGEEFQVFNEGEELVDPDTKEVLERVESSIGVVRITRVTTKLSYAEVISGDAAKITPENAVCRRAAPPPRAQ